MYFSWVFLLLLNEYEEEGKSDPGKKEWPRKGMSQEMTQKKKESILAFFRQVVGFIKLHFHFILFESITKKWIADEHYNRSKLGS